MSPGLNREESNGVKRLSALKVDLSVSCGVHGVRSLLAFGWVHPVPGIAGNHHAAIGKGHELGHFGRFEDLGDAFDVLVGAPIVVRFLVANGTELGKCIDVECSGLATGFLVPMRCVACRGVPVHGMASCRIRSAAAP